MGTASTAAAGCGIAVPHNSPLAHGIEIGNHQHCDKHRHRAESRAVVHHEILEAKRPRVQEHHLQVKYQEEDGHQIELDGEERRRAIPVFNDREEEIRYLLQPEYKEYLQAGMQALTLN